MKLKIRVTREDITSGEPKSALWCQIALAARKSFVSEELGVSPTTLTVDMGRDDETVYALPLRATLFVLCFDKWPRVFQYAPAFSVTLTEVSWPKT